MSTPINQTLAVTQAANAMTNGPYSNTTKGPGKEPPPLVIFRNRITGDSLSLGLIQGRSGTKEMALTQTLYSRDEILQRSQFSNGDIRQTRQTRDSIDVLDDVRESDHRELYAYSNTSPEWNDLGNTKKPETWHVAVDSGYTSMDEVTDLYRLETHGFANMSSVLQMVGKRKHENRHIEFEGVKLIIEAMFHDAAHIVGADPDYQDDSDKLKNQILELQEMEDDQQYSPNDDLPVQPYNRFCVAHP